MATLSNVLVVRVESNAHSLRVQVTKSEPVLHLDVRASGLLKIEVLGKGQEVFFFILFAHAHSHVHFNL